MFVGLERDSWHFQIFRQCAVEGVLGFCSCCNGFAIGAIDEVQ